MQPQWTTPEKESTLKSLLGEFKGVDAGSQGRRVLAALHLFPVNTFELRALDVLHPAGRIKELRDAGHSISMHWIAIETEPGVLHRIGNYVLDRVADAREAA